MPRDGSGTYTYPSGTRGIPATSIESLKYNNYIDDIAIDLNTPRPISAGGTGGTTTSDAMTSLRGDTAYQVVTNYDTFPFVSGSFYSASTATNPPVAGHAFVGICYTSDPAVTPPAFPASANLVIEARDQNDTTTPGRKYVREKKSGVWGAWSEQAGSIADLDTAYVNVAGDTMTGPLVLPADPTVALQAATKAYVDTGDTAIVKNFNVILFTNSGTYTPSAALLFAEVQVRGSGGGGGGVFMGSTTNMVAGAGGGQGSLSKSILTAATIGASQSVTIGPGGAGGAIGDNNGVAGGDCSFGTLVIGKGGGGGKFSDPAVQAGVAGLGGDPGTGQYTEMGLNGGAGVILIFGSNVAFSSGAGGGQGGALGISSAGNGSAALGAGGGGSGAMRYSTTGGFAGGAGLKGYVLVKEYLHG